MATTETGSIVFACLLICCILKIVSASTITCNTEFHDKQDNTDYVCPKEKCPIDKHVYGSYYYTSDSTVCRSAWHDGRIIPWSDNDADRTVRWTTCTTPSAYLLSLRYGAGKSWGFGGVYSCNQFVSSRTTETLYRLDTLSSMGSPIIRVYGGSNVDFSTDVISASVYDTTVIASPAPTKVHYSNTVGYKEYLIHTGVNVFTTTGNKMNLYSRIVNINYGNVPLLSAEQSSTLRLISPSLNLTADAGKAIDGNPSTDFMRGRSCSHTLKRNYLQNPWWRVELGGIYSVQGIEVTSRNGSHDCKNTPVGREYMGTVSEHRGGETCRMWKDTRYPSLPENYCRNPDGEPDGPWCYTISSKWGFCDVSLCSGLTESLRDFQVRVSNTSNTPPASSTDILCKHYTGTISDATTVYIACDRPVTGRYIYIIKNGNSKSETLSLCEVEVFGTPAVAASTTLTTRVDVGDGVTLTFEGIESYGVRWQKDGLGFYASGDIVGWNDKLTNTIDSVEVGHGGVYTVYKSPGNVLGITRLVVRVCPSGKYGVDCTEDCPQCENGGICHDITGECICPPGFMGHSCSIGCGGNLFGSDCLWKCSEVGDEQGCRGKYVCTIDPYGCSCVTGFKGVTCSEDCQDGYYGADCQQACGHCINNTTCNPYTGHCRHGCALEYMNFPFCKTEIARLKDPPAIMSRTRTTLSIRWTAWRSGTDHGVGPVVKYVIEYKQDGGGVWNSTEVNNVANQPTFTHDISNTDMSHVYLVRIRIKVAGGLLGNSSPEVEACGEPQAPEPSLSNTDANTVDINWPEAEWRCGTPGWYVVEYNNGTDTTWETTFNITSNDTSLYTTACTTWRVRVRTFNKHMSSLSCEKNITSQNKAPSQVQGLVIETGSASSTSLTVEWKKPESNGCPIEGYLLTYRLIKVLQCSVGHSGDDVTEILHTTRKGITGLKPNSKYAIKVAATTEFMGEERLIYGNTLEDAPSGAPQHANVIVTQSTSLSFSWSEVECLKQNGNVSIYRYQIRNSHGPCVVASDSVNETDSRDVTFVTLTPYTTYELRVQAMVGKLAGPWTVWTSATTNQSVPTAPKSVMVIERSPGSVTLSWSAPCPPRGLIVGYMVQYRSLNRSEPALTSVCNNCTQMSLQNLHSHELYEFKVKSKTIDWGEWSSSFFEKTNIAPRQPTSFGCAGGLEQESIRVTWASPGDTEIVNWYLLTWTDGLQTGTSTLERDLTEYVIKPLSAGKHYTISLTAGNPNGVGRPATVSCWTALPDITDIALRVITKAEMTDTTVTIHLIPPTEYSKGIYFKYGLVVVETFATQSKRRRAVTVDGPLLKGYEDAQRNGDSSYITANLTAYYVGNGVDFKIGDGKIYGQYTNVELHSGYLYRFMYGVFIETDAELKSHFQIFGVEGVPNGQFVEVKDYTIHVSSVNEGLVIGAVCGALAFVILFGVLGFLFYRKRRTSHETRKRADRTGGQCDEPGRSRRIHQNLDPAVELSTIDISKPNGNDATNTYETVANFRPSSNVYEKIEPAYWTIPYNSIVFGEVVGKGSFGDVLSATIATDGAPIKVALKRLNACATDKDKTDFIGELNILSQVGSHTNVISLIGACEYEDILFVATEYASKGNLRTFLRDSRMDSDYANVGSMTSLSEKQLLQMALDVSRGMKHLAAFKIIHRDLAARNILVSEDMTAKISDFGLSRNEDIYVKHTQTRVPVRWMSPESLFDHSYTTKSDVWSFGILLWEIVTLGGTPYSGISSSNLLVMLKTNYRMSQPCNCSDDVYELMTSCWSEAPRQRPTFNVLVAMIEDMLLQRKTFISVKCGNDFLYETIDTGKDDQ